MDVHDAHAEATSLDSRLRGNDGKKARPLSLTFAIPDHPWVDTADGAAVRIAMTAGIAGSHTGRLLTVETETDTGQDEIAVTFRERIGVIHADLSIGADVAGAQALASNAALCCPGFKLHGAGFIVTPAQAQQLGLGSVAGLERHIRAYRNGRDLTDTPRDVLVIDLFGLEAGEVRARYPALYQHVLERVKPERDAKSHTKDGAGYARLWWLHGKPRQELRKALKGLPRYIATVETAKHRTFQFLDAGIAPDNRLVCIALDDAQFLGVLSSSVHVTWALNAGGTLEDRPVYNKTRCFDPFAFPAATEEQRARIRDLGEQLDAHRKRQQALHPDLTLTGMYNVLEKLRAGETLTDKERVIHEHGLVSVLRQLHDELDAAVLEAYGWSDLLPLLQVAHGNETPSPPNPPLEGEGLQPLAREEARRTFDEAILERLVALNAERAAEEARGIVRWLRPEFQHPSGQAAPQQAEIETAGETEAATPAIAGKPRPWPKDAIEQVRAVAGVLAASAVPLSADEIAVHFSARGAWKKRLPPMLDMLTALGRAREHGGRYSGM